MCIRSYFPFFQNNPELIYLDSAATSQKPKCVIDSIAKYLETVANPGRSDFGLSQEIENKIEKSRVNVANFFGTQSNNLAFTFGVTDGMNIVTNSLAKNIINYGDEILICDSDHKSTFLPWIELTKELKIVGKNIQIKKYLLDPFTGLINIKSLLANITERTRFVVLTHAHNVYGLVNSISDITNLIPKNIITVLDMAQTAGHIGIDFKELNVGIVLFSGHKMFALEGVGGLIARDKVKDQFKQVKFGGGETNYFPYNLEIGTQNTVSILSLSSAVGFINSIGIENMHKEIASLTRYLVLELNKLNSIELMPGVGYDLKTQNTGIVSFVPSYGIDKLKFLLSQSKINLRIGQHCTQELKDSVRVSLHAYNNIGDLDRLLAVLRNMEV